MAGPNREEILFIIKMRDQATRVLKQHGRSHKQLSKDIKRTTTEGKRLASGFRRLRGIVFGLQGAIVTLAGTLGVGFAIKQFGDLQEAMIGVQKTSGATDAEIAKLKEEFIALSDVIPVSAKELADIGIIAGQLGIKGSKDILSFTEVIARMGQAADISGQEAALTLARLLKVMKEDVSEAGRLGSVIVALGNDAAAGEREIANLTREVALNTARFRIGTTEAAALGTAFAEMGQEGALAGTSVGRVFGRFEKLFFDSGEKLSEFTEFLGITNDEFRVLFKQNPVELFTQFVVALGKAQREGRNFTPILKLMKLEQQQTNKVILALAANYENLIRNQKIAREEAKKVTALTIESNAAFLSQNNQIKEIGIAFSNLGERLGGDLGPTVQEVSDIIVESLNLIRDNLDTVADAAIIAAGALVGLGAGAVLASIGSATIALGSLAAVFGAILTFLTGPVAIGILIGGLAASMFVLSRKTDGATISAKRHVDAMESERKIARAAIMASKELSGARKQQALDTLDAAIAQEELNNRILAGFQTEAALTLAAIQQENARTGVFSEREEFLQDALVKLNERIESSNSVLRELMLERALILEPRDFPGRVPSLPITVRPASGTGTSSVEDARTAAFVRMAKEVGKLIKLEKERTAEIARTIETLELEVDAENRIVAARLKSADAGRRQADTEEINNQIAALGTLLPEEEKRIRILFRQLQILMDQNEEIDKATSFTEQFNAMFEATLTPIIRARRELARFKTDFEDATGTAIESSKELAEQWRIIVEDRFARAREEMMEFGDETKEQLEEMNDLARDLGLTFTSAFEDAIVKGKDLRSVLNGLIEDIKRVLTRKFITEPFLDALGGSGGGGGFGGIIEAVLGFLGLGGSSGFGGIGAAGQLFDPGFVFPSAKGNAFVRGRRVRRFGHGGIVGGPTLFGTNEGLGIAGESGEPEGILPLTRLSGGDLGVRAEIPRGRESGVVIQQTVIFQGITGATAQELQRFAALTSARTRAGLEDDLLRRGRFSRLSSGRR